MITKQKCIVKTWDYKWVIQNQNQILTLPLIQCHILTLTPNPTPSLISVQCFWICTSVFFSLCICILLNKPADSFSFAFSWQNQWLCKQCKYNAYFYLGYHYPKIFFFYHNIKFSYFSFQGFLIVNRFATKFNA